MEKTLPRQSWVCHLGKVVFFCFLRKKKLWKLVTHSTSVVEMSEEVIGITWEMAVIYFYTHVIFRVFPFMISDAHSGTYSSYETIYVTNITVYGRTTL